MKTKNVYIESVLDNRHYSEKIFKNCYFFQGLYFT